MRICTCINKCGYASAFCVRKPFSAKPALEIRSSVMPRRASNFTEHAHPSEKVQVRDVTLFQDSKTQDTVSHTRIIPLMINKIDITQDSNHHHHHHHYPSHANDYLTALLYICTCKSAKHTHTHTQQVSTQTNLFQQIKLWEFKITLTACLSSM